jgi:hypothetical protein
MKSTASSASTVLVRRVKCALEPLLSRPTQFIQLSHKAEAGESGSEAKHSARTTRGLAFAVGNFLSSALMVYSCFSCRARAPPPAPGASAVTELFCLGKALLSRCLVVPVRHGEKVMLLTKGAQIKFDELKYNLY